MAIGICGRNGVIGMCVTLALALAGGQGALAQDAQAPSRAPEPEHRQEGPLPGSPASFADLSERLVDAVVNISTSQTVGGSEGIPMPQVPPGSPFEDFFKEFFENQQDQQSRPRRVNSLGSGFVVDPEGIVITNNHVISDADEIVVNFNDGTELPAEIVGVDPQTDVAVLRVEPTGPLPYVEFGDSDDLRVGDWVLAIGNPFGLGGTVTAGIVSAQERDINAGPYDSFIQTDASINRGNSGGPLFDMNGRVVGINTAIISPTGGSIGIGFAVPTNLARSVIDQLIEFGETRRGWLGVRIQSVTDEIADSLGMDDARGALVAGVSPDGPAAEAGIETGDVILQFGGRDITEMRELPRIVAETEIGREVDVLLLRRGEEMTVGVTIARLEDSEDQRAALAGEEADEPEAAPESVSALGLQLSDLSEDLRTEHGIEESVEGAVITEIDPDGPAAGKQLNEGDVVVEVSQEKVSDAASVVSAVEGLRERGRNSALLLVSDSSGELRFVVVPFEDE